MIKVSPSILSADFSNIAAGIKEIELSGADMVHMDVMDGMFVPNITFGQPMVAAVRKMTKLPLDVHLMIERPERYIEEFADAGADIIVAHVEATKHIHRVLQQIRLTGKKPGLALNPGTPIEVCFGLLNYVEMVLIMSVNPGFGGQKFIPESLIKARKLRDYSGNDLDIQFDGGVSSKNAKEIIAAGVNVLVSGSAFFNAPDKKAEVRALRGE
ncbi:MAG: ribulose-phosphate 3-epimerase [Eubacteriales bacterium]